MSTTAKLYRVTVTEIYPSKPRADVWKFWVAARDRKEARKRALGRSTWSSPEEMHVLIECMTDGCFCQGMTRLEKQS